MSCKTKPKKESQKGQEWAARSKTEELHSLAVFFKNIFCLTEIAHNSLQTWIPHLYTISGNTKSFFLKSFQILCRCQKEKGKRQKAKGKRQKAKERNRYEPQKPKRTSTQWWEFDLKELWSLTSFALLGTINKEIMSWVQRQKLPPSLFFCKW